MLLKLPAGRAERAAADVHVRLARGAAALPEVAGRAGGGDILPGGAAALGAGQDMVEGQLARVAAILAGEAVAQEQVESGEGRMLAGAHILPERDHARQLHRPARAVHLALIGGDDVDPFQKDRLDGGLPRPQAERVITERRIIRVEDERGAAFGMTEKVGMVQGQIAPVFRKNLRKTPPPSLSHPEPGDWAFRPSLLSRHAVAILRDGLMTP